ncbi:cupin domain-containing protein [Salinibius halmophilus]|uniref:cupin domain-containing protein n=1 Tax=Salinibius halmophilus TaxID=1853216 RepID=UPI0018F37036|nr:cupin domain-containing protein [Salinibius halmophilus]
MSAQYWINKLNLERHPEGGWYKRVHTSEKIQPTDRGDRNQFTSIYYLLEQGDYSAWHRIQSEELWAWHAGDTLAVHTLVGDSVATIELGADCLQHTVPAKHWFASQLASKEHGFCLVSCVVSPGFDFADFEMAQDSDIPAAWQHLVRA